MNTATILIVSALLTLLAGCSVATDTTPRATDSAPVAVGRNVDNLLVVDCLLPGQLRRLGQIMSFVTPKRPVRASATECAIRGGEYVEYDRANFATSLKIWLPRAESGDAEAQTYVGEVFEKGLGLQSDPVIAADWYRKAAEQGYSRAQINLGYLYEGGIGVPQDLTRAMNYYRLAAGYSDGNLEYVTSVQVAARKTQAADYADAQRQNAMLTERVAQLKERQAVYESRLAEVERLRGSVARLRTKIAAGEDGGASTNSENDTRLAAAVVRLQSVSSELANSEQAKEKLIQQLKTRQAETSTLRRLYAVTSAELQEANSALASRVDTIASLESQLETVTDLMNSGSDETITRLTRELDNLRGDNRSKTEQLVALREQMSSRSRELEAQLTASEQRVELLQSELLRMTGEFSLSELDATQQRQAFERELRDQQVRIEELREQIRLDTDSRVLAERDTARQFQLRIDNLERQLAAAQINGERMAQLGDKSDVLKRELTQERARYGELESEYAQLESRYGADVSALQGQLAQAQDNETNLKVRLDSSVAEIDDLKRNFALSESDYRTRLDVMEDELLRINDSRMEAQLATLELAKLEGELSQKTALIASQEIEIDALEQAVKQVRAEAPPPEIEQIAAFIDEGPVVEIIDPPVSVLRGGSGLSIARADSQLEIIGRVEPVETLLALKINGAKTAPNESGVFQHQVETPGDSHLRIVAIDQRGLQTSLEVEVRNAAAKTLESDDASSLKDVSAIEFGAYHALLIGNNDYENLQNLKTAENDAVALEEVLRNQYGFKTELLLNATRYDILSALNRKRAELTNDDNLLIYYAGHGELANNKGYWMPIDAEPDNTSNWISNVSITDIIETINAKHIMIVADSCYSGTLSRSSISRLATGLTPLDKLNWYQTTARGKVRTALTSGGVKPVVDSTGESQHSLFSSALLDELNNSVNPVVEAYGLYLKVQARVKTTSRALNLDQNPQYAPMQYAGHESGEFLFVVRNSI